jgi:superfamily II DNA or RNA helicase
VNKPLSPLDIRFLRDYQRDAVINLSQYFWDGERQIALVAPTGSGKTVIISCVLKRLADEGIETPITTKFRSAVIVTPFVQVESSFISVKHIPWGMRFKERAESCGRHEEYSFQDFFLNRDSEDYWTKGRDEFIQHIRSCSPRSFALVTTHHAIARWGVDVLPENLSGRVLVIDEAHHAGSDGEGDKSRKIAVFANEWFSRGGAVCYCTTPYRADDLDVLPEGTKSYIWSMADHAMSGFAPKDFRVHTEILENEVDTRGELFGDELSDQENKNGQAYNRMVDRWIQDDCPKAIFIVPGKNSKKWASRLEDELTRSGARVLNAVGVGTDIQEKLTKALKEEREVKDFGDSKWDVILCCKRFDEGTDWPLCSHVYNYGIPSSFGLTVQRWGRAFRDKSGIKGHSHPDSAHLVFFFSRVNRKNQELFEQYHHEYSCLLACYISRWTTAREFGRQMRHRGEEPWVRRPERKKFDENEELIRIRDDQAFQITEEECARGDQLLVQCEIKFKAQNGRLPTAYEKAQYLDTVEDVPPRVLLAARLNILEHLPVEAQVKYEESIRAAFAKRRQSKNGKGAMPAGVITNDAEMRAIFLSVVEPYRDQTYSVSEPVIRVISQFSGENAREIEEGLRKQMGKTVADFPELVAEWHPTKNGELKPSQVSYGSNMKVWWLCPVHSEHEWMAAVSDRVHGSGCPYCRGLKVCSANALSTTHPELALQWHPTKNGDLTPDQVTAGSNRKVWWRCSVHPEHEWEAIIANRAKREGTGCPYCCGLKACPNNALSTTHPELALEWHPTRNGDLTPDQITAGSNRKVWWRCSTNLEHEWEATIASRSGTIHSGCPYCSNRKVLIGSDNSFLVTHPDLARQWHPTRNGDLTPGQVTAGSGIMIWWRCPVHPEHEWMATVGSRVRGNGCPYCSNQKVCMEKSLLITHPDLARQWHPVKNGDLTPDQVVAGSNKKIWWQCPTCGHVWSASVKNRSHGRGCPQCWKGRRCGYRKPSLTNSLSALHPDIANQWHPTKNGNLTPDQVTASSHRKVWWQCSTHSEHEWESTIANRTGKNRSGCPHCSHRYRESKVRG